MFDGVKVFRLYSFVFYRNLGYSSMKAEIEKVKDLVTFEEIKEFYGLDEE